MPSCTGGWGRWTRAEGRRATWHLTWSSATRHPLFPDEALRRTAVQALVRVAPRDMALFCLVDDHVHVVFFCDEARLSVLRRTVTLALRPLAAAPLERPFVRPVRDRSHLVWLAERYLLRQPWAHGLGGHPALWSGSCFLDLAGARWLPGLDLRLRAALPRVQLRTLFSAVFLGSAPLEEAPPETQRAAGAARLAAAAAAALAADPALAGNGPAEALARRACVQLAGACGLDLGEAAHALGITRIAAARLLHRPVPPPVLAAVRRRIHLEDRAAAAPPPPPPPLAEEAPPPWPAP